MKAVTDTAKHLLRTKIKRQQNCKQVRLALPQFNMYQWTLLSLLAAIHYTVLIYECVCSTYQQLLPRLKRKASRSRGIRPAAPKCIALAVNDADFDGDGARQLRSVLQWLVQCCSMDTAKWCTYNSAFRTALQVRQRRTAARHCVRRNWSAVLYDSLKGRLLAFTNICSAGQMQQHKDSLGIGGSCRAGVVCLDICITSCDG